MSTDVPLTAPQPEPLPAPKPSGPSLFAQLGHLLYNHNPFYLISAFLTLYGIHAVFGVEVVGELKTASVLLAIGAYTAVLGLTGVLIVRIGKVWEDARTVLLAVILLLLATSVCTDELLMLSPDAALLMIVGGLSFAIALCEFIIRGLQIRFGAEFRIPLFLQLSILFLYPYFCAAEVHDLTAEQVQWRVLGFPLVFSLGLTTLWPAVLRGSARLRDNGTPWNWPLYPWCLFIVIAAAGAFRCRILTESFDPTPGMAVTFGSFYLLPILLTVVWLVIETGIVENRRRLIVGALWSSLLLLFLAMSGSSTSLQRSFYEMVALRVGSPLFWAVIGLGSLYGCARLRGVREAMPFLLLAVGLLAFIGPQTIDLRSTQFVPWPLGLVGLALLVDGHRRESTTQAAWGCAFCLMNLPAGLQSTPWAGATWPLVVQASVIACGTLGFRFRDSVARDLETTACLAIPALVGVSATKPALLDMTSTGGVIYAITLTALSLVIGVSTKRRSYLAAGLFIVATGIGERLFALYRNVSTSVGVRGLWALSWSMASFVTAVLISFAKSGHLSEIRQVRRLLAWLHRSDTAPDVQMPPAKKSNEP